MITTACLIVVYRQGGEGSGGHVDVTLSGGGCAICRDVQLCREIIWTERLHVADDEVQRSVLVVLLNLQSVGVQLLTQGTGETYV